MKNSNLNKHKARLNEPYVYLNYVSENLNNRTGVTFQPLITITISITHDISICLFHGRQYFVKVLTLK